MSAPTPLALTDAQIFAVFAASHPLAPDRRSAFLEDVARQLAGLPEIDDGAVHRVTMVVQRKYFDPPDLDSKKGVPTRNFTRRSAVDA